VPRIEAALLGAFTSLQSAYACGQTEERATAWKALLLENAYAYWHVLALYSDQSN
jgi:hypothetical protein